MSSRSLVVRSPSPDSPRGETRAALFFSSYLLCALLRTFIAPARHRLDVFVPVFFSVIVGQFFAGLYIAACHDVYAALINSDFTVWPARVIDIPSFIYFWTTVERYLFGHLKEVFASTGEFFSWF